MYASITEKSNDTEDPVLLFATLAVAEAKSAPSSGSFAFEVTWPPRAQRLSSRHTIQSLSKHAAETATMMLSFGAFSVANTHPIREKRF